jgi:hypothetical protein
MNLSGFFKNQLIVYVIMFTLSTMSCAVYHPNLVDIPLINKRGAGRINAGISPFGYHGTVSVGITKKMAIQTFGSFAGEHIYYVQQSIGYYKDLGNKKVLELYSGFGYGYGDAYNDANPGDLLGNYQVYFTQFNFGKIDCDFAHADLGIALKTGLLHSKLTDRNYYARNGPPYESSGIYTDNSLLMEPQAFVRIGGRQVKLTFQIGAAKVFKFTNTDKWFPAFPVNFGLGINCNF